jgi:GTP-binding protein HflX
VAISGLTGLGIEALISKIDGLLFQAYIPIKVKLPYSEGQLISLIHESGQVESIKYGSKVVEITGKIPGRLYARFQQFEA